jgi:hypothetical protein
MSGNEAPDLVEAVSFPGFLPANRIEKVQLGRGGIRLLAS